MLLLHRAGRRHSWNSYTMTASGVWSSPTKSNTTCGKKTESASNTSGDMIGREGKAAPVLSALSATKSSQFAQRIWRLSPNSSRNSRGPVSAISASLDPRRISMQPAIGGEIWLTVGKSPYSISKLLAPLSRTNIGSKGIFRLVAGFHVQSNQCHHDYEMN